MLVAEHENVAVETLIKAAQSPLGVASRKAVRMIVTGATE